MKFQYLHSARVSKKDIEKHARKLESYREHLVDVSSERGYGALEASINLPNDGNLRAEIEQVRDEMVSEKLRYVIVVGIGGSSLGTKAIYDAMFGYSDLIHPDRMPKIIFLETNNPGFAQDLADFIKANISDPEEIIVNAISKSGGTTETIANLEFIVDVLKEVLPDPKDRLVITSDDGSKFANDAWELGVPFLEIPDLVGGRFSVFSSVGLFPLACVGLDIHELHRGARRARERALQEDVFENNAMLSAIIQFHHYKQGKNISDMFLFLGELESVGKWYRQLMGESVGKQRDLNGKDVNIGITPTVSIGSNDLHSVGQLYLGGPRDKITTFVSSEHEDDRAYVPQIQEFPDLVHGISGTSFTSIMDAILEGTKIAYSKRQLPFMEIILPEISEQSLAHMLQFKMIEMMYLGKLLNVNTFDQPNVESYKVETKSILNGESED